MTAERVIARFRAALKLIYPDDITPMGKRILERILDEEEEAMTLTIKLTVALRAEDLAELPVGSRIATNTSRIMELDEIEPGRKDSGSKYWIQSGTLEPFQQPPASWFPAFILPPVVSLDG
ncbi:MAG: hypothetical protein ACXVYB_01010 [Arthrobacter sp.]